MVKSKRQKKEWTSRDAEKERRRDSGQRECRGKKGRGQENSGETEAKQYEKKRQRERWRFVINYINIFKKGVI